MGSSGGSSSKARTYSVSNTTETPLSQQQLEILKQRQAEFNAIYSPAIKQGLLQNTQGTTENKQKVSEMMSENSQQVNTAFADSLANTRQNLAQANMSGNSGVAATLNAKNERARASALSTAYANVKTDTEANKQKYLEMGLSMSPTATQAAPTGAEQYSGSASFASGKGQNGWQEIGKEAAKSLFSGR